MSHRPSSSYGPGTVKEHAARIKGPQHRAASASSHVPIMKQSLELDGSSSAAAAADAPLASLVVLPANANKVEYTRFKGCKHFRERLVCATLSGKPIRIDEIRALDERPGIRGQHTHSDTTPHTCI